jgi:hypothetical protein
MTNTAKALYTLWCECCEREGAAVMVLPCGGFAAYRPDCLKRYERQLAHDNWANAQGLDD